ncbi:MAG: aminoglycoside phosphotransferase family protein [Rubrobacteraceae bacterium]
MRVPPSIPESLARNVVEMRGDAGAEWLERLPELVERYARQWFLEVYPPFPSLSVNWVAPAVRADGTRTVLKLSFPGDREFKSEAQALEIFDGRGVARLLELDLERGVMLLERLEPGAPLATLEDDEEATSIAAGVMKKMRRPAPPKGPFPTVFERTRGLARLRKHFDGGTGPMPTDLVDEAESLFADLIPSQDEPVLLHGDLHHENILKARRSPWLAIDPKGVVGEPAFDVGALLHNPVELLERPNPKKILERRIRILSEELDIDRARIVGWGISQAVLAAYWSLEDSGRVWEEALVFARLLSATQS